MFRKSLFRGLIPAAAAAILLGSTLLPTAIPAASPANEASTASAPDPAGSLTVKGMTTTGTAAAASPKTDPAAQNAATAGQAADIAATASPETDSAAQNAATAGQAADIAATAAPESDSAAQNGATAATSGQAADIADTAATAIPAELAITDARTLLTEKIKALGAEYGFMAVGSTSFEAETLMDGSVLLPEKIKNQETGILLTNIADYDRDGNPELLVVRRQPSCANVDYTSLITARDRNDYIFEMYEAGDQTCTASARMTIGVFDVYDLFVSSSSTTIFLHEKEDGTDICMETHISGQDHPGDTALVRFQYRSGYFRDLSGLRYGGMYAGEGSIQYMEPESLQAYGYLSTLNPSANGWKTVAAADDYSDETFSTALKKGLESFGFSLKGTRNDIRNSLREDKPDEITAAAETTVDEATANEATANEATADEAAAEADKMYAITAADCYAPLDGSLSLLAFTETHLADTKGSKPGFYKYQINRTVSGEETSATERPRLGE